jgi:hypothetical protein
MWKRLVDGWDVGLCDVKLYSVDGEMMCGSVGVAREGSEKGARRAQAILCKNEWLRPGENLRSWAGLGDGDFRSQAQGGLKQASFCQ